ncbi:MAG TPA: GAF domain-containing protein [Cyanobacteria bacterium UBA11162]|nr:GAF domain-containing protein [Cyanobacteria bacterium UBA12227]HAX88553.1 GAF domain-containing protein [Cyanobacteria bacterium UBA11370]HBL11717.1 GAF domain-containing protein [Cyanobacteria bacterium UBA11162]HBY78503.1 GAF domain-containing protein [Cyanobacteria bacterium UBA11148]
MLKSYSVHPSYIQEVNLAWKRKSEGRDRELVEQLGISPHLIHLFLKGQPVKGLNFVEICQLLGLDWRRVSGLDMQENSASTLSGEITFDDVLSYPNPTLGVGAVDQALNELVSTLCELLRRLTRKAGNLLRADRTSIFLLDQEKQELGSLIAEDGSGGCLIIDMPADRGIASLAATSLEVINIPFDVYDDPRSEIAKSTDKRTGYRTYTILAWPLLNGQKDLVAVVQLINKLKLNYNPDDDLFRRVDIQGFTAEDEALFGKFAPSILQILERCQFCYQLAQKLRGQAKLNQGNIAFQQTELIAQLKRQEQQLRKSLERIQ